MIKRIYVEADNLKPLTEWLKTKPTGQLHVLVGGSDDPVPALMNAITKEGRSFGQWVAARMLTKELVVRAAKEKPVDLDSGIVVESEE